ncbi:MAG TPA: class I SAM-dependent methyltransferase [Thermomicrobiales bacterium]
MRRSPPYSRYAEVYDKIGQRVFGEHIAEATLAWLSERGVQPRRIADLACGTGAATLVFAAIGATVYGVDRSPEMLAVAAKVMTDAGLSVEWLCQDIRDLCLPEPVDLATCFFDSVNYLTEDGDLPRFFARVHHALVPGGYFVFDLNTRRRLADAWGDACIIAADREDLFGIYRSWFDPATDLSPLQLTFFVRDDSQPSESCWVRFDEEHVERAYALADVAAWLADAGFDVVDVRAFNDGPGTLDGPGSEESERVVFFARKPDDDHSQSGSAWASGS